MLNQLFDRNQRNTESLFDEGFLRRLERLSFNTSPALRGGMSGERRSRNLRPALDFNDHRPYTHGDDLRHVDWKIYFRHEELVVKLGEAPQSINLHLLIDRSRSMAWSPAQTPDNFAKSNTTLTSVKWRGAYRLGGALAYLGLAGGERVEIATFAQTPSSKFGPVRGKRLAIPMLKFLTGITPDPATKPAAGQTQSGLVHSLVDYARRHPQGGLMVLVSDLLDTALLSGESDDSRQTNADQLAGALHYFPTPRWQVLVLHLLTEQEVNPTFHGDSDLQDLETGENLPFHFDQDTLTQYSLRVKSWCAQLQTACAMRGAMYAQILAESPLEQSIIPYLRRRGAIQ